MEDREGTEVRVLGGALAPYLFHEGTNYHTQDYLGVRAERTTDGVRLICRCFAPDADAVFFCSDLTAWQRDCPLFDVGRGVFERVFTLPDLPARFFYKWAVTKGEETRLLPDPFAVQRECGGGGASVFLSAEKEPRRKPREPFRKADHHRARGTSVLRIDPLRAGCGTPEQAAVYYAGAAKRLGCSYLLIEDEAFSFAPPAAFGSIREFARFADRLHRCGVGLLLRGLIPNENLSENDRYHRETESIALSLAADRCTRLCADGLVFSLPLHLCGEQIAFLQKLTSVLSRQAGDAALFCQVGENCSDMAIRPVRDGGLGFHGRLPPDDKIPPDKHGKERIRTMADNSVFFADPGQPKHLTVAVHHRKVPAGKILTGAIPGEGRVSFRVSVSYGAAFTAVRLLLRRDDDGRTESIPLLWESREGDVEIWSCTKDVTSLCKDGRSGLFFYRFRVETPYGVRFLGAVHGTLRPVLTETEEQTDPYFLTVYEKDFRAPVWLQGCVMYQIFPDRFCRGEGPVGKKPDAVIHDRWDEEIEQYGERPGDFVRNNEFFGGNLWGVREKLGYLKSLGVDCIYLCPIFLSPTNHRYDTTDYTVIDPLLGGEDAFCALTDAALEKDVSVILDGVFDHTGDDSVYFNARGTHASLGAAQSKDSPYYPWFRFRNYPDDYECWWGVRTMPQIDTRCPSFREFLLGKDGVLRRWQKLGAAGYRLDVADELSPEFLEELRLTVKEEAQNAVIYGEVWEDASDKIAYDTRRRYFRGRQLDAVMNYPCRDAVLRFVRTGDAEQLKNTVEVLFSHYPRGASALQMNLIGSHDTERVLTVLGGDPAGERGGSELRTARLSPEQRAHGVRLLMLASVLQFTLPGVPCIYYGDEAGMEGYRDPFCRRPFPWGREDPVLTEHYKTLGAIRHSHDAFRTAEPVFLRAEPGFLLFSRSGADGTVYVAVNAGRTGSVRLPARLYKGKTELLHGGAVPAEVPPLSAFIFH